MKLTMTFIAGVCGGTMLLAIYLGYVAPLNTKDITNLSLEAAAGIIAALLAIAWRKP